MSNIAEYVAELEDTIEKMKKDLGYIQGLVEEVHLSLAMCGDLSPTTNELVEKLAMAVQLCKNLD